MPWRLHKPEDSEIVPQAGGEFVINLPQTATAQEVLDATVIAGWQSDDDAAHAGVWRAFVIQGEANTFVLKWEN